MKLSTPGAIAALVMAAALAACGGKAQFAVQGTISGLANAGLTLANGGDTITVPAGAESYAFPHQIAYGTSYSITIPTQPAHQTCNFSAFTPPTGSAGFTLAIAANLQCLQNAYTVGGQFTGLTPAADGTARTATLINGSAGGAVTVSSATDGTGKGDFQLGALVNDGASYGVTILTQPVGLTCTLTNGTGVMHETLISNLLLACVPN